MHHEQNYWQKILFSITSTKQSYVLAYIKAIYFNNDSPALMYFIRMGQVIKDLVSSPNILLFDSIFLLDLQHLPSHHKINSDQF